MGIRAVTDFGVVSVQMSVYPAQRPQMLVNQGAGCGTRTRARFRPVWTTFPTFLGKTASPVRLCDLTRMELK